MITLAVSGAAGRMGRAIVEASQLAADIRLGCAIERSGSDVIGVDAGELAGVPGIGVVVSDVLDREAFDVLIEFTNPGATLEHVGFCADHDKAMVIGTTGLQPADHEQIARAADTIPIVLAPNMSVGVNVCLRLLEIAARALGDSVDIEIIEAHHRHKIDAPSGTALRMGEVISAARGRALHEDAVFVRSGAVGERPRHAIGFATVRAGDIVGEHTVMFVGDGERIELTHRAASRMNFAYGALRAARWVSDRESGLYAMHDVLDLS